MYTQEFEESDPNAFKIEAKIHFKFPRWITVFGKIGFMVAWINFCFHDPNYQYYTWYGWDMNLVWAIDLFISALLFVLSFGNIACLLYTSPSPRD